MILNNPILIRFARSSLRAKKAIVWYLLVLIITGFVVGVIYFPSIQRDQMSSVDAARAAYVPILFIQGIIMLLLGTGSVAGGITQDKVEDVLNYQRLTPLSVWTKIAGYLFGLPIREYVLFAITLPFLIFVLWVGKIPFNAWAPFYLIFFTSTLLYHLTGLCAGMVSRKWRLSARLSQGLVISLYLILPQLSHLGVIFLEYLTVRPVFAEKMVPTLKENLTQNIQVDFAAATGLSNKAVPFFNWELSGTFFSLVIQILLGIFFLTIIARKWSSDEHPAIGKKTGLIAFSTLVIITLGNLWPNLVRSENSLPFFQNNSEISVPLAIVAIPLVFTFITAIFAFFLMSSFAPNPVLYKTGLIRAAKLNLRKLSPLRDESSSYMVTGLIATLLTGGLSLIYWQVSVSGYLEGSTAKAQDGVLLIFASALMLFLFQGIKEFFGGRNLMLIILVFWILPILIGIFLIALKNELSLPALISASVSPVATLVLAATSALPMEGMQSSQAHQLLVARWFGLSLLVLSVFAVHGALYLSRKKLDVQARPPLKS